MFGLRQSPAEEMAVQTIAAAGAFVLAAYAVWLLAAELVRPTLPDSKFPPAFASAEIESARSLSGLAAAIGVVRRDLWAERAMIDAGAVFSHPNALTSEQLEAVRSSATRALSLGPFDSRTWLILAAISRPDRRPSRSQAFDLLKMSYYTGPNDRALVGARLHYAIRIQAFAEPELSEAMRREIRAILRGAPELQPSIVSAYSDAGEAGRKFIEDAVAESDTEFRDTLRAAGSQGGS